MLRNALRLMPFTVTSALAILASACASIETGDTEPEAVGEAAERQIAAGAVQVGVGDIGLGPLNGALKQTSLSFDVPFGAAPVVLASPQGGPFQDTFAVTTTGVGTTGFNVNLYRTDAAGWGQDLELGWLALAPTVAPHTQAGTAFVGSDAGPEKTISVTFSQPFAATPRVILTARGMSFPDTFATTTTQVTTTGFTANVWRADAAGWGQPLQLDWMAWDSLADLSAYSPVDGTADIGNQYAAWTPLKSVSVSFGEVFTTPPTVLVTARGGPYQDTFSVTAASVTTTGFTANVDRVDYTACWGQDLHLDWIALPQTRNTCPSGQTMVTDTGACVTLTPWTGGPLPNGVRIAMRASTRDTDGRGLSYQGFGPAWVKLTNASLYGTTPNYDYLDASGATLTSSAIYNVTVIPPGAAQFVRNDQPISFGYQQLLLQGFDGMYVTADSYSSLASMTDQHGAAVLLLSGGTNATLYWSGFSNGTLGSVTIQTAFNANPMTAYAQGTLTLFEPQPYLTPGSYFQLYTVQ